MIGPAPPKPPETLPFSAAEKARLEAALARAQAAGGPITYNALAQAMGLAGRHRIHRLTLTLEDLIREDHAQDKPLRAALAISRATAIPGPGFFQLLNALGRYDGPDRGKDAADHHALELAQVLAPGP